MNILYNKILQLLQKFVSFKYIYYIVHVLTKIPYFREIGEGTYTYSKLIPTVDSAVVFNNFTQICRRNH